LLPRAWFIVHLFFLAARPDFFIVLVQVYGGLKDQDRIFTNLYGEGVRVSLRWCCWSWTRCLTLAAPSSSSSSHPFAGLAVAGRDETR
jgi:hypothetical protein